MELQYTILDVFTSKRLEGNPLAVVSVPAALKDRLTQEAKLKVAKEFNLSETVFLHEETNPQSREIDIFTIEREIPFAGHPTIGTAILVKNHVNPDVDTLVAKTGPIGIVSQTDNHVHARIPHNVHLHAKTLGDVVGAEHTGLSPVPEIRDAELKAPVFSVVKGMTFILVRLPSLELLGRVSTAGRLDFDNLPSPLLDEGEWSESFVCRYYYVDVGEVDGERGIRSRMIELGFEDPATGSAATALGSYLTLKEEGRGRKFRITQGVEIGRTSHISVETTTQEIDGSVKLVDLWLGGTAVVIMKGSLTVDV
ncbi:Diaminopimelate epimerase-like protein [Hypoxylon trugodes]|uniref:Diaminopimelate epimerase-like protein n=1 Tax=Hypoxylon trugodes TaxID=326681 RepID=UPI00219FAE30|nr:Diaminopimelate epimerase-like protein [Hypoxylon trugodes]KAI1394023.1 Diaminopimelate epimerase-like protein [Hypoxylon trugodes]